MPEITTLKCAAIIADLTNYLQQTKDFESKHTVIEKHVSTQITVVENPAKFLAGQSREITTVLISVLYVFDASKSITLKN